MGKKITDFSELPAWFRETDYLAAHGFSNIDWYFHLESRSQVLDWEAEIEELEVEHHILEGRRRRETIQGDIDFFDKLRSIQLEIIRRQPASPIGENIPLSRLGPAFSEIEVYIRTGRIRPIARMTLLDLYNTLHELPKNTRNDLLSRLEKSSFLGSHIEDSAVIARYAELSVTDLSDENQVYDAVNQAAYNIFRADLSLPNDVLERSFQEFLASARSEIQAYSLDLDRKIKPQYKNWVDYGVLPYMDLKIWAHEIDRSITAGFIAKAFEKYGSIVDPDCGYSAYTVDTTLKKYVDAAFSIQTRSRLRGLASKEIERRERI